MKHTGGKEESPIFPASYAGHDRLPPACSALSGYAGPWPQQLNEEQALEYVRSRHVDLVGDFGRSARQQQVLHDPCVGEACGYDACLRSLIPFCQVQK